MIQLRRYGKRDVGPKDSRPLVLEGELVVWEQEGGYASPQVTVGAEDVTRAIESEMQELKGVNQYTEVRGIPGKWRLTLEKISD